LARYLHAILASAIILATLLAGGAVVVAAPPFPPVTETEFIQFFPQSPLAKQTRGECWTSSNIRPRINAWRCMVGNQIYDPCFSQTTGSNWVACDIDPVSDGALGVGLRVNLNKPLPSDGWTEEWGFDWVIELEDGQKCIYMDKDTYSIAEGDVNYACAGADFILGDTFQKDDDPDGLVYYANKVLLSPNGSRVIRSNIVPARRVWN
jgi:hypothetical protein